VTFTPISAISATADRETHLLYDARSFSFNAALITPWGAEVLARRNLTAKGTSSAVNHCSQIQSFHSSACGLINDRIGNLPTFLNPLPPHRLIDFFFFSMCSRCFQHSPRPQTCPSPITLPVSQSFLFPPEANSTVPRTEPLLL